jgi:hypothetical protein
MTPEELDEQERLELAARDSQPPFNAGINVDEAEIEGIATTPPADGSDADIDTDPMEFYNEGVPLPDNPDADLSEESDIDSHEDPHKQ